MIARHILTRMLPAALLALFATVASAVTLEAPTADYTADRIIESAQGNMKQKIYASGLKERMEMNMSGMQIVSILRRDKEVMWTLMPAQGMYMELDLKQALEQQPASGPEIGVEITEMGSETVDGIATTKYKMTASDQSAGGFLWLTRENIPLKMDMLANHGGDKHHIVVRLENLKVGKQDAALFEIPAGLSKMPAVGNFGLPMPR